MGSGVHLLSLGWHADEAAVRLEEAPEMSDEGGLGYLLGASSGFEQTRTCRGV